MMEILFPWRVQVARYTALFTGVVYGWYHRRQLQADHDIQKQTHAVHERKILIAEAKEAYKKKLSAPKDPGGEHFLPS